MKADCQLILRLAQNANQPNLFHLVQREECAGHSY